MVPVTRLPDLCLLALFRQMTLEDQIGARKVCRRWADLVLEATSKRRELILLLGKYSIEKFEECIDEALFYKCQTLKLLLKANGSKMYPTRRLTSWNSLQVKSLDQASAVEIASTFIGAQELQVAVHPSSQLAVDNLGRLLELWSHQLVTLQVIENFCWNSAKRSTTRLFAAINALSALKKLHLDLLTLEVPDLSIVSQLEELRFFSHYTTPKQFAQWLQQYGEGNRGPARIEYRAGYDPVLKSLTALSEHLRHRFTRLNFYRNEDLVTLTGHFRNLTTLFLFPHRITLRYLFTHLANLHQFIHLYLTINSKSFKADDQEHHHLLLPQVKSLKALEMHILLERSAHQELAKLAWTVPNVEVICFVLFPFQCSECNVGNFQQPSEQAKSCLRQLFAPLKRDCTKLRLIKHNYEQVHGTAEELLAE